MATGLLDDVYESREDQAFSAIAAGLFAVAASIEQLNTRAALVDGLATGEITKAIDRVRLAVNDIRYAREPL